MNLKLAIPFYLGLGMPCARRRYPDCAVRAARGRSPDLVRALLLAYRGEGEEVRRINHRCAEITLPDEGRFFFKEFSRLHRFHDLERALRLSRVDRAWRAAHLLPRLGIATPRAVGTALARAENRAPVEYLATEWLEGARPFPEAVRAAGNPGGRLTLLREFALRLRQWYERGVYLRDLVKNVLVTENAGERTYWLTDLDGLHPAKRVTRARIMRHMRQIAHYVGPLTEEEARTVVESCGIVALRGLMGLLTGDAVPR